MASVRGDCCQMTVDNVARELRRKCRLLVIEERGRGITGEEAIGLQDRDQGLSVGDEAVDVTGPQSACELRRRGGAIGRLSDDLGQHRVVVGRHDRSGLHAGVHTQPVRDREARERAGVRQVAARGILGVETHLDRMTAGGDLALRARQLLSARDADLPLDEVEPGDHLGDGVLHLQAGVHLEEVKLLGVALSGDDELNRAGSDVADALRQ